jgi:hypothetical protein
MAAVMRNWLEEMTGRRFLFVAACVLIGIYSAAIVCTIEIDEFVTLALSP